MTGTRTGTRTPALALLLALLAPAFGSSLPPHPRLLLTPDRAAAIKDTIATNAQAAAYFRGVAAQAASVLALPPVARPPDGGDVLFAARDALVRTYVLGAMWRLTGNATFAARGAAEVICFTTEWSDWQPNDNALVMGELSHAAAIGLDWLHDFLSEAQRAAIVAGLVQRGAAPFAAAYAVGESGFWWVCRSSNWASVTNSGAGLAALALLGEAGAPPYVPALLANATRFAQCSAAAPLQWGTGGGLAPDGAWWEGPMYSGYVLRYVVPFATALGAVTGDASLLNLPGLLDSPLFQVASMDAAWRYFNWADCVETQETLAMLLATAERGGDVGAAFALRARLDATTAPLVNMSDCSSCSMEYINALLFFSAAGDAAARDALPLDLAYPEKMLALFRSSWDDDGAFVGFRAGSNCSWYHGDMDAGTFVYTWGGQRWVSDLGADNYGLPGYFGGGRFQWYRKNSRGHSTLQFNHSVHDAASCSGDDASLAPATWMAAFSSAAASSRAFPAPAAHPLAPCDLQQSAAVCATADLTGAFARQGVAAASRTLSLDAATRTSLTVADRWTLGAGAAPPPVATAALHTFAANVTLDADGKGVLLQQGGRAVRARVGAASPCPAAATVWQLTQVRLAPPQDPSDGLTRIDVTVDPRVCGGLDVVLFPVA